ncbi:hypothetical protein V9K67_05260 [Paraflavisolibacter sp. H34]
MENNKSNDKVPFFSSWKHWYLLVIAFLALQIFLFYQLTKYFS